MSSLTSGSSGPGDTSRVARVLAVVGVDFACFVVLAFAGFSQGMENWGRATSRTPRPPTHTLSWAEIIIGAALAIHAGYAYRRWWIAEAGFQGLLAIVALLVGISTMSSSDRALVHPDQPSSKPTTTADQFYCYSGGTCYLNGVPVSGHP